MVGHLNVEKIYTYSSVFESRTKLRKHCVLVVDDRRKEGGDSKKVKEMVN